LESQSVEPASQLGKLYGLAADHPSVSLARSEKRIAEYDLETAEWGHYPSLSVNGAQPFDSSSSLTLTLEQPIYTAGRTDSLIGAAGTRVDSATIRIDEALQDIQLETASAYVEMLRAQRRVIDAEANIRELEKLFAVIERRVKQDISARAEQTLVQARLQQAISDRHQYLGLFQSAKNRIRSSTGETVESVIPLDCSLTDVLSETDLVGETYSRSPRLKRIAEERRSALYEVNAAEAERYPRIVLGAEHISDLNAFDNSNFTAYIGIQYQLQDGFSLDSRIASARARVASVDESERLTKEQLRQQVAGLVRDYQAAKNQLPPLTELVESNEGLIESYLRQYRAGKKTWLDVINAQREMIQARFLLTDSYAAQCASAVRLELLTGASLIAEAR
jgi:adhesin transport system outer membrane protein